MKRQVVGEIDIDLARQDKAAWDSGPVGMAEAFKNRCR